MPFTVSGDRPCWRHAALIFVFLYGVYLLFDYSVRGGDESAALADRKQLLMEGVASDRTGLILGGSNALYSLSAEILSQGSGIRWYNLALPQEGYGWGNYVAWLRHYPNSGRDSVEVVVYSSIDFFVKGRAGAGRGAKANVRGESDLGYRPTLSLGSRVLRLIRDFDPQKSALAVSPTTGDLAEASYHCGGALRTMPLQLEDVDVSVSMLREREKNIKEIFPKARVVFVTPSYFPGGAGGESMLPEVIALWADRVKNSWVGDFPPRGVSLAVQPPYPGRGMICDAIHHASIEGRDWRSKDLLREIASAR